MKVHLLKASKTKLFREDAEQRLSRFIVSIALAEHDHVVDLESATVRVPCLGQLQLIRAFSYKVIVQYQFHLDVVLLTPSVFPGGATHQAGYFTRCLIGVRLY